MMMELFGQLKDFIFFYSDPSYINNDNNLANKWKNLFESSIKE